MKILLIHNKYEHYGGEDVVVASQIDLLRRNGQEVITYFRESEDINKMNFGKLRVFFSGIYNSRAIKEIKEIIKIEKPDIVHIHNLYPLISPAILPVIKKMGIPIVMTVHNYRLLCPNGLFFTQGKICEECIGKGKEINCIKNNCEDSLFKSTGYALRNYWARRNNYYTSYVDVFICLSEIQRKKLEINGFDKNHLFINPNTYPGELSDDKKYIEGQYVGYVGRISPEKGSEIIIELAKKLPHIQFKIAGAYSDNHLKNSLNNVEYVGFLESEDLNNFYLNSLFTLFTSTWNETFGMAIIEAFAHKKPVIASDLGASPEIIKNNLTGLIYKNKDLNDLVFKVQSLVNDKDKIRLMGENAFINAQTKYSSEVHYKQLNQIYSNLQNHNLTSTIH